MSSWEHLETASNIVRRRNPPRIPWATTLHLSFRTLMIPRWTKNWNSKDTWWPSQGCPLCFDQRGTQGEAWSPAEDWLKVSNLAQITWLDPHLHTAPDKEQLPGTHFRDIFHHYIAGERWIQKIRRPPPLITPWGEAQPREHSAAESKVNKWRWSGVR